MSSLGITCSTTTGKEYSFSFDQIGVSKHHVDLVWDCKSAKVFFDSLVRLKQGDAPTFNSTTREITSDQNAKPTWNPGKILVNKINRKRFAAFNPNYVQSALKYVADKRSTAVSIEAKKDKARFEQNLQEVYALEVPFRAGVANLSAIEGYYTKKVATSVAVTNIQQKALDMLEKIPLFESFAFWKFDDLIALLEILKKWPNGKLAYFERDEDLVCGTFITKEAPTPQDELFVIEAVDSMVKIFTYLSSIVIHSKEKMKFEGDWEQLKEYKMDLLAFIMMQKELRERQGELKEYDSKVTPESKIWEGFAEKLKNPTVTPVEIPNAVSNLKNIFQPQTSQKAFARKLANRKATFNSIQESINNPESSPIAISKSEPVPAFILTESIKKRRSEIKSKRSSTSVELQTFREIFDDEELSLLFELGEKELTKNHLLSYIAINHHKVYDSMILKKKELSQKYWDITGKRPLERQFSESKLLDNARDKLRDKLSIVEPQVFCSVSVPPMEFTFINALEKDDVNVLEGNATNAKKEETVSFAAFEADIQFTMINPDFDEIEKIQVITKIAHTHLINTTFFLVYTETKRETVIVTQKVLPEEDASEWDMPAVVVVKPKMIECEETLRHKISLINNLLRQM